MATNGARAGGLRLQCQKSQCQAKQHDGQGLSGKRSLHRSGADVIEGYKMGMIKEGVLNRD